MLFCVNTEDTKKTSMESKNGQISEKENLKLKKFVLWKHRILRLCLCLFGIVIMSTCKHDDIYDDFGFKKNQNTSLLNFPANKWKRYETQIVYYI